MKAGSVKKVSASSTPKGAVTSLPTIPASTAATSTSLKKAANKEILNTNNSNNSTSLIEGENRVSEPEPEPVPLSTFSQGVREWLKVKRALREAHEKKSDHIIRPQRNTYKYKRFWKYKVYDSELENNTETIPAILENNDPIHLEEFIACEYDGGDDMNAVLRECGSRSLLQYVVDDGDYDKFKMLIDKGADIHHTDENNDTALILAVQEPLPFHQLEIFDCLVKLGSDINHQNRFGMTALHKACLLGNVSIVRNILKHDCNVHLVDRNGKVPLQLVKSNRVEIIRQFKTSVRPETRRSHHLMWAHIMSRDFVDYLFKTVEPICGKCKRKVRDCGKTKMENYRLWSLRHLRS